MKTDLVDLISRVAHPLVAAGVIVVVGFLVTRLALRRRPIRQLLCQLATIAGFTAMLAVDGVIPFEPTPVMDPTITYVVVSAFKIVWWLAAAWLVGGIVRTILVFKRRQVETQFLQDLCAGVIYGSAVMGIIANVFDMAISGLLAASGVIAIVLGLALQSTLGDVFSGVVLNISKPYRPGDWVILDGGLEGRVIETNWRATQILTDINDIAFVPNSIVAKSTLRNASRPTGAHGLKVVVRLDPTVAPSSGVAVLETAMLGCNRILRIPPATVMVRSLDAVALECELDFFVALIEQAPDAQNEVFDLVWRQCAAASIRLAPPSGSAFALPPRGALPDLTDMPKRLLQHLPVFTPLSDDERLALAPMLKRRTFNAGDVLLEQGIVAPALFILTSGVLAAMQQHQGGEIEALRLAPGDCFGQASVMTGAVTTFKVKALTRVIVYEIAKDDIAPILKQRPAVAAELSQIMMRREAAGKARLAALNSSDGHPETLTTRITDRIKGLFGLEG
jgi:small-conductance mechanosensitive channel/CRP-like cAMP-binding protein